MKKLKFLILICLLALTGCGGKNSLSPEETIKKAAENIQKYDNYKMEFNIGSTIEGTGISIDFSIDASALYDKKNETAKLNFSTNFFGNSVKKETYQKLDNENNQIVEYNKNEDGSWTKSTKEKSDNKINFILNNISNYSKSIKEVKSDKNNYNYELVVNLQDIMSSIDSDSNMIDNFDVNDLKGDITLLISIDKKTLDFSKFSIDIKDVFDKVFSESMSSSLDKSDIKVTKAEMIINFDYNTASVTIPEEIIKNASTNNSITCSMTTEGEETVITATADGDEITKVEMKTSTTVESQEDIDASYSFMQLAVGMINAYDGVEAKLEKENLTITMIINMDFSEMSDETKEEFGFDVTTSTLKEFKENAEQEGATCK